MKKIFILSFIIVLNVVYFYLTFLKQNQPPVTQSVQETSAVANNKPPVTQSVYETAAVTKNKPSVTQSVHETSDVTKNTPSVTQSVQDTSAITKHENFKSYSIKAKFNYENLTNDFNLTKCAKNRTNGQKVISYSFYGKRLHQSRTYFQGIERNIAGIQEYYPGWFMRVYYNVENESDRTILYQLQCKYSDILDLFDVGNLPVYGNITVSSPRAWRFIALADPLVDIVMSRDLDSLIIPREVAAVNEWINDYPNAALHIMRDHPSHDTSILGGMWGAKIKLNRTLFKTKSEEMLAEAFKAHPLTYDQNLLAQFLWPLKNIKDFILAHDSYLCKTYTSGIGIYLGFPTERNMTASNNFIGAPVEFGTVLKNECPVQCRRNVSWIYC